MLDQPRVSHDRLPELDGFRAIAILMVFAVHLVYATPIKDELAATLHPILRFFVSHGWLGVDLFFILSGLLITGILLDARGSPRFFRNFYIRRALRIMPLYYACIVVMAFFYRGHGDYFGISTIFLSNYAYGLGILTPNGPGVFWSLAVEEHFYLLWPLIVFRSSEKSLAIVCIVIVAATPILRGIAAYIGMEPEMAIYEYSQFRFDGLALGALLAIWIRSGIFNRRGAFWLTGLLMSIVAIMTVVGRKYGILEPKTIVSTALRYTQAQFMFAAALVLALAYRQTALTKPLRSKFLKFIAGVSFCVYLVHLAIMNAYEYIVARLAVDELALFGPFGTLALRTFVIGAATLMVAVLSKKYLEEPFLALKERIAPSGALRQIQPAT